MGTKAWESDVLKMSVYTPASCSPHAFSTLGSTPVGCLEEWCSGGLWFCGLSIVCDGLDAVCVVVVEAAFRFFGVSPFSCFDGSLQFVFQRFQLFLLSSELF